MKKVMLGVMLWMGLVWGQNVGEPQVVVYTISPSVTVTPPISAGFSFDAMAIVVHRVTTSTDILLTLTMADGSVKRHFLTLQPCNCELGTWRIGGYIGIGKGVVSTATWAALTPGTAQVVGIAK